MTPTVPGLPLVPAQGPAARHLRATPDAPMAPVPPPVWVPTPLLAPLAAQLRPLAPSAAPSPMAALPLLRRLPPPLARSAQPPLPDSESPHCRGTLSRQCHICAVPPPAPSPPRWSFFMGVRWPSWSDWGGFTPERESRVVSCPDIDQGNPRYLHAPGAVGCPELSPPNRIDLLSPSIHHILK